MNLVRLLFLFLIGLCSVNVFGSCPFQKFTDVITACMGGNDLGIVYKAGTSKTEVESFPLRPNKRTGKGFTHGIGCVDETPSPAWYAIKIDDPGTLFMDISHSEGADIDFVCWGPFYGDTKQAMLENVCNNSTSYFVDYEVPNTTNFCKLQRLEQCESKYAVAANASAFEKIESQENISNCKSEVERRSKIDTEYECFYGNNDPFPIAQMMDCSFSKNASEPCYIPNAKRGEWYIILVTNFEGSAGNINFTKIDGSATTDCSVIVDAGSNSPVCEGDALTLIVNNVPAFASCKWTGPNGFESNEIAPIISSAQLYHAGTYYVQITTHDGLKSDEIPVKVEVNSNLPVDTTVRIVQGSTVKFKDLELSAAGKYKATEKRGSCTGVYNVTVVVEPLLPAFIEQNGPLCDGDSLVLSIGDAPTSGVEGYEWSGPNGFHSKDKSPVVPNMNRNKAGEYSLKIKKDGLVYPVAPVNVEVIPPVKEKVQVKIPFDGSYEFDGQVLTKQGVYKAQFESAYGCDSIVELYLVIEMPDVEPAVVVSPNGDGNNDVWTLKNIDLYPEAVVRIYDRYGKEIYAQQGYDEDNAWDGRDKNGQPLPSTDYWYTIDVQSIDRVYYGHVTLVR
ncbi:MAG: T9SS type B sorting domain-containing protein [Bacteroidales bacterium]|nr:T9SS type B sorting domain-containing protein [Candidatus Scybalocola fimicaballi]